MTIAINRQELHKNIYLTGLFLLVCSIPLSNYLLSISQFILAINWLLQGNFQQKWSHLRKDAAIIMFASVFFIYALGFFRSSDSAMAIERIKNALPLLALPIIMGTSIPLSKNNLKNILLLFCGSVMAAAIVGFIKYTDDPLSSNYRELSYFMNSIRFALLIDMATIICLYLVFHNTYGRDKLWVKILYMFSTVIFIVFLIHMKSISGIGILLILIFGFTFFSALKIQNARTKYVILTLFILTIISIAAMLTTFWCRNFTAPLVNHNQLELFTVNHNRYVHNNTMGVLENGHYIHIYICNVELVKEWNRISSMPADTTTESGNKVRETLIRYLTSLGLRKDSTSIHQLTRQDIEKIEKGIPNYRFKSKSGIFQRLHESLWEFHVYQKTGYVKWHSFGQRLAFLKTGKEVFLNSPWLGTGTGDVYNSMVGHAHTNKLEVDPLWHGKPHNQYLFFLIAFGIIGFAWLMTAWIFPVIFYKAYRFMLFNMFALIMAISMIILDALEGYQIMVFFSFFYALFVYTVPNISLQDEKRPLK